MKTDIDKIYLLLEKFYDGSATEEEETFLRDFFRSANAPADLEADRRLFAELDRKVAAPAELKENIGRMIDIRAAIGKKRRRSAWIIAAAASLALAITAGMSMFAPRSTPDTEMSPEEIRMHTLMALNKLTGTVEKGCSAIQTAEDKTIETTQKAIQSINSL